MARIKIKTESGAELTCKLDKEKAKSCSNSPKFTVGPGKHKLKVSYAGSGVLAPSAGKLVVKVGR